ncbi:TonB-dependent receptor plug domain-containing protein [Thauera linaloolentis]|uniref:TonB-dependent receptor n=1 Tax=Thauera linaloolentis (strain DSM 12138 / JCM 21573 / CCUG 41526 / CIP 105981 / IAM 15112 / NBRC 102519 / 47Lol) TaxID=1123367 RepID=N6ZB88_THAL4|nr:TonB-dependent receptor [Thauera linaloolentis]ENO89439.1 TonB-dependent receptor [Thauera linaloolentis 47Lol = DSM 12138]MCM8566924.1 TonB-dependent receptor [Thauera linaloolentis]
MPQSQPRLLRLAFLVQGLFLAGAGGHAAAETTSLGKVGDVVVTTGIRGIERTVADSPAPIDVVSGDTLRQSGNSDLKEVLNRLLPSFNLPAMNGGGTSYISRAVTMRGLPGDQVLVLVNGKRRHNTALINNLARVASGSVPTDLDLIPLSAVERIEVLRDGAAAQYGSDAIAGVINIILKRSDNGVTSETTIGQNYERDGETFQQALDGGFALGSDGGFLHWALNYKTNQPSARGQDAPGQLYHALPDGSPDPREATADRKAWGGPYGQGEIDIVNTAYNAELPLANGVTLYSFSTLSYRHALKNTGSFLPTSINALPELYPDGITAYRVIDETDFQVAAGARGETAGWHWDLSSTYGRDRTKLNARKTLNASLGPASPTSFHLTTHIFEQWTNNADVTRQFDLGLAKPLQVSFGAEHRYERFQIKAGEPDAYTIGDYVIPSGPYAGRRPNPGLVSYNGTSPAEAGSISRDSYAAYADIGADITQRWYLGAALRAEHYTDSAGDTVSGKLSSRYVLAPGLAIRGTVNNGFRAPSLAQSIYASNTVGYLVLPDGSYEQLPQKVLPVGSPEARALGAEPLDPEKSLNYSLGITFEPNAQFRLTVDAYQIKVRDRIVQTGLLRGPTVSAILAAGGFDPNLSAQYYTNAVDTVTRGVDLVSEYTQDLDEYGLVRWGLAYAWNKTSIDRLKDTPAVLGNLGYELFDRQKRGELTVGTPRDKVILSANWLVSDFDVNLRLTRYGKYSEISTSAVNDRTYSAKWITDLDIAYAITPQTTLAIGANNLFDVYPDKKGIPSTTGTFQYGQFSPFGFTGGYYYARLTHNF